jgi:hypothetical protein
MRLNTLNKFAGRLLLRSVKLRRRPDGLKRGGLRSRLKRSVGKRGKRGKL